MRKTVFAAFALLLVPTGAQAYYYSTGYYSPPEHISLSAGIAYQNLSSSKWEDGTSYVLRYEGTQEEIIDPGYIFTHLEYSFSMIEPEYKPDNEGVGVTTFGFYVGYNHDLGGGLRLLGRAGGVHWTKDTGFVGETGLNFSFGGGVQYELTETFKVSGEYTHISDEIRHLGVNFSAFF